MLALFIRVPWSRLAAGVLFLLAGGVVFVGIHGLALSAEQRNAAYSTRYYYGEAGLAQAIQDVRDLTPQGGAILGPKDVGFESDRPFYEDALLFPDPTQLGNVLASDGIQLVVTRKNYDYSEQVWPGAFAVIRQYMTPVLDRPGSDFVIWKPTHETSALNP